MTELVHGQIIYRIDGDMAATNQYAAYLMTGAFILLSVVTASRIRPLYRVLLAGPLALTGLALLLTYSRGAWLGSGIGLLVLLLMLKPRRAFATVGLLAFVGLVIEAVHPGAGSQIVLRANDIDRSIQARETYETTGLQVLMHYPFGAGWGAWFRLVPGGIQAIPGYPWYHDDYLQLATELGIPGLLSLLAILGSVVWTGWTAARKAYDPNNAAIVAGLTAALVGMLVQTATDQFLWHADIAPHIWIVAGLMLSGVMLMRMDDRRRAVIADAIEHAEEEARERDFALPGAQ
jgi:O-antigen ligase